MKKYFLTALFLFVLFFAHGAVVLGQVDGGGSSGGSSLPSSEGTGRSSVQGTGLPSSQGTGSFSSGQIPNGGSNFQLVSPIKFTSICGLIKALLNTIMSLGIPIAMLFLVYSGFLFVIARGNVTGLQKARTNLVHVVVGIGIFLGAWLLGQIVANTINAISPGSVSGINSCN
jgi:hypothetical protein